MNSRRRHISMKAKLHAALFQLGMDPETAELDHRPALSHRLWNEDAQDTVPPASDPRYLVWMAKPDHAAKTRGTGATTAGSDVGTAAKLKRVQKDPPGGEKFRQSLFAFKSGSLDEMEDRAARLARRQKPKIKTRKQPWPKNRPFPKRTKT